MRQITMLVLITIFASLLLAQNPRSTPPLLMDGHVHITNRVCYEGIDPWKAQRTGDGTTHEHAGAARMS
jgi:hypothetical protein